MSSSSSSLPTDSTRSTEPSTNSTLKQLKSSLTLDLSSPNASTKKQSTINEDLLNIIKASPSFEKFIAQGFGSATTPTPTKLLYPSDVTLAQRQYAQGFIDALTHVHQLNGFVPTPTLLNSPSILAPFIQSVTTSTATTVPSSKPDLSPVISSPSVDDESNYLIRNFIFFFKLLFFPIVIQ
ncbi:hypothetical protein AB6A40_007325 [Gnathostoma spinigerum]|uniref:Jun-like transcription factor domain-containing protein n=1 Tax=Gnathostoma spinigerum TaxID=75299 RepID=A0ABD6ELG3_9BILA